ncbi:hypothetical protein H4R21_003516 [Coemansia helicoidea]|uniref:Uncharacterized protein n=1 Tax=Coemansia helicoidea TaxID=1286919 RepID=A0ACC1L313_9FUNG|nr:hypothetical protein H4R21_003516 [Coemansia helicoidea]
MAPLFLGHYTRLVFLGDSNVDNGNVLRMTGGTRPLPSAVYWRGRYCNGKAWCDHLGDMAGVPVVNLAHGCATIDNAIVAGTVPMPGGGRAKVPSVADQVDQLASPAGQLGPGDLVFVQVGSNDLNSLIDAGPTYRRKRDFSPALLAGRLAAAIERLCVHAGACTVVVLNVRPREDYPAVLALGDPRKREQTRQATAAFNAALRTSVDALRQALGRSHTIDVFDTYAFQKGIASDPAAYGIDPDTQTPCYDDAPAAMAGGAPQLRSPDSKLFVDGTHLAKRAQALLAADVARRVALLRTQV